MSQNRAYETYMVVMQQEQEGCDHSINCGIDYRIFRAYSLENAREKARDIFFGIEEQEGWEKFLENEQKLEPPDGLYYTDLNTLSNMFLCKLIEDCPFEEWEDRVNQLETQILEKELQEKELQLLAQLKAKYEPHK